MLCCEAFFAGASAADREQPPLFYQAPKSFYDPNRFELRGGVQAEFWGWETGTVGLSGELVFPRLFTIDRLPDFLTPRFQLGGVFNTAGKTSFVHADLLWTVNYTERIFGEMFAGVTVHNGYLDHNGMLNNALGCRVLFHVGFNLGMRLDRNWSVIATYDHSSAGQALTRCPLNDSLNQAGVKLGYQF